MFPKKQVNSAIRNHSLFDAFKKVKYYDTEVSHEKERIIVAKQVGIDLSLFKATATISIENVDLFFSLINDEMGISDTYFYFFECLGNKLHTSWLPHNYLTKDMNLLPGIRVDFCVETTTDSRSP